MSAKLKNFFLGVMLYSVAFLISWVTVLMLSHLQAESFARFFVRQNAVHQILIFIAIIIIVPSFFLGIIYIGERYLEPLIRFQKSFIYLVMTGVLMFFLSGFLPGETLQTSAIMAIIMYYFYIMIDTI